MLFAYALLCLWFGWTSKVNGLIERDRQWQFLTKDNPQGAPQPTLVFPVH
jgi:hypothetical protein